MADEVTPGMAYQNLSALNAKPFFQNLYAEHHIWENRFSFQLSPTGAELFLGGTNRFKYSGEIEYTPVTKPYLVRSHLRVGSFR